MTDKVFKKARGSKGHCEFCGKWVRKGEYFTTTGTDGHGGITGLTHKDCSHKPNSPDRNEKEKYNE